MSIPEVKIAFLGDVGVGKTSLFHRFISDKFIYDVSFTQSVDLGRKDFEYRSKKVCFAFQDTSGFETVGSQFPSSFFRSVQSVIFVYDLSDQDSLYSLETWKQKFDVIGDNYVSILVGNKIDLLGQAYRGDLLRRIKSILKPEISFQVSAKTGQGCNEILNFLVEKFHNKGRNTLVDSIDLHRPPMTSQRSVSCCSLL